MGGCSNCKMTWTWYNNDPGYKDMICTICWNKHFSDEAILRKERKKKLRKLTKKWWEFWK